MKSLIYHHKSLRPFYRMVYHVWPTLFCLCTFICLSTCNNKDVVPDDICCPWCTGPDGGEVEITDTDNAMVGVRVVIPQGAWDHCRAFALDEKYVYAPPFPAGFMPYGGYKTAFGIQAGGDVPDSLYMEIYLPLHGLSYESDEILCAFYYEESADRWRIRMPDEITEEHIVIKTPLYKYKWSWGIVALDEADWDKDLEPLLSDIYEDGQWEKLKAELTNIYQTIIKDDMDATCDNVKFVRTFFETLRNESETWLVHYQDSLGNVCRVCDVTTSDFYDGYFTYIEKKVEYFFIQLMFFDTGPNLLIMAFGFMRLCEIMAEIENLACDYACFFAHCNDEFRATYAAYAVATVLVYIIDYAISTDYVDCS